MDIAPKHYRNFAYKNANAVCLDVDDLLIQICLLSVWQKRLFIPVCWKFGNFRGDFHNMTANRLRLALYIAVVEFVVRTR